MASSAVFSGDPSKKFDVVFAIDMKQLMTALGAKAEQIRQVMENRLPRPRDYRSPEFLQLVDQLHAQNHALKTDVVHHFEITSIERDAASLTDNFVNQSYEIDAVTKQPVGSPSPATTEPLTYRMQIVDGVWKVVRAIKVTTTVVQQ